MITAVIIDDEPLAHDVILTYANDVSWLTIKAQYYSATEALAALKKQSVDLLFLDIKMPVLTGLELLKILPNRPQIILTTAYQEYALESYELDVTDYLLKPFRFDRFLQALHKVQMRATPAATEHHLLQVLSLANHEFTDSIFIKVDKKQVQIQLSEVSLFEAYGNYVKVWRNNTCQLTPRTLSSFEQELPAQLFVRVHKSAIVNRQCIDFIEGDSLTLHTGQQVPIGKQFKKNLTL